MDTATLHLSSIASRPTLSCIRCAERKVKCDRQRPCGACVKHNVDCIFNPSQPPRQRHKRIKNQILIARLRQYESLLEAQGINPDKLPGTPNSDPQLASCHIPAATLDQSQLQDPPSVESDESGCFNKTQVVHDQGRFKFVDNSLWTRVVEEFHNPEDALADSSDDTSDLQPSDDEFDHVLGSRPHQKKSPIKPCHPAPDRIDQLWQTFIENVDPLTKVVHVPTLRPAFHKATSNISNIPRGFEALMFAIYGAAIMSLSDDECREKFCEPRKTLLSRYISATKAALSRAKFMATLSLVVLQALILHLLTVRDIYEPLAVWSLTGVAIRIAQGMGLERDGVSLGLPPFETEMRRRVWWLLKTHDFRTAELCGLPKFRDLDTGSETTQYPTNINDDELYTGMPSLVAETNTVTDCVFVALRYEFLNFAAGRIARFRKQGQTPSQWNLHGSGADKADTDGVFRELQEIIETKFLRYCDPSQPLHLMTMLIGRFSLNGLRFMTNHPRRWPSIEEIPSSERRFVWGISIQLLEQYVMLQSNFQLKRFAWQAAYFQQWPVLIHVLDSLRVNPLSADSEKAWHLIGQIYENTPNMISDTKKPIHVAVGNLCLKAYRDRQAALQDSNIHLQPTPTFILQLRQQREDAKIKRQARDEKSSRPKPKDSVGHGQAAAPDVGPGLEPGVINISDTLGSTHLQQQNMTPDPPMFLDTSAAAAADSDPFWYINGFDDSHVGNFDEMMNMDLDFMPDPESSVERNAAQSISWEQWDTWLADSNKLRPIPSEQDME